MKSFKSLVIASALIAGLGGSASANTLAYVHIVGGQAYRQSTNDAIQHIVSTYGANGGLTASSVDFPSGASIRYATQNQWKIINYTTGVDLIINASYTGSTAGIESVASIGGIPSVGQEFIPDGTGTISAPVSAVDSSSFVGINSDNTWITISGTFQASTIFNGNVTLYQGAGNTLPFTQNYQTLNGNQVGVEPYRWVVSPGSPSSFTNITAGQAQQLYANGTLPLSFFTGNYADHTTIVYALSRDTGSGSRIEALTEIGYELPGTEVAITTYKPTVTGGTLDSQNTRVSGTIASGRPPPYPAGLVPSTGVYDDNAGDRGYASSGNVYQDGLILAITSTAPAGKLFVTYLNISDSTEAAAAGAKILTYNGVAYSSAAVASGNYTFWGYEWLYTPSFQTSVVADFTTKLINQFPNNATVPISSMYVNRVIDGGVITSN